MDQEPPASGQDVAVARPADYSFALLLAFMVAVGGAWLATRLNSFGYVFLGGLPERWSG